VCVPGPAADPVTSARSAAEPIQLRAVADVAQLVERNLAKVEVAGSNPVVRSMNMQVTAFFGLWPAVVSVPKPLSGMGWPCQRRFSSPIMAGTDV
jgi:hypothetical protein